MFWVILLGPACARAHTHTHTNKNVNNNCWMQKIWKYAVCQTCSNMVHTTLCCGISLTFCISPLFHPSSQTHSHCYCVKFCEIVFDWFCQFCCFAVTVPLNSSIAWHQNVKHLKALVTLTTKVQILCKLHGGMSVESLDHESHKPILKLLNLSMSTCLKYLRGLLTLKNKTLNVWICENRRLSCWWCCYARKSTLCINTWSPLKLTVVTLRQ
jgi:hypothetical protein